MTQEITTLTQSQTMSSLQIAELTGKRHDAILRDIRNLLKQGVQAHNFVESYIIRELPNGGSKQEPCFNLTKKGCLILASGYDAKLRERIIDRWEELETEKQKGGFEIPQSFSEALMLAANQAKQIEEQQKQLTMQGEQISEMSETISEMLPKVSYYDRILASKELVTTTQIAADYGTSAQAMNKQLRDLGIQRKVNGQWILRPPYISRGYAHSKPVEIRHSDGSLDTKMNTQWRQSGRLFIYDQFKAKGILPLIERQ